MDIHNTTDGDTADREIVVTRRYAYPRERVWAAWTDPKQVAQWWGPKGFTSTIEHMEVSPGGVWRLVMHGPDGTDHPNEIVYLAVEPPSRLVYDHGSGRPDDPGSFRVIVGFEPHAGGTRLTLRSIFRSAADRDFVIEKHDAIHGANESLDRLGAHLESLR